MAAIDWLVNKKILWSILAIYGPSGVLRKIRPPSKFQKSDFFREKNFFELFSIFFKKPYLCIYETKGNVVKRTLMSIINSYYTYKLTKKLFQKSQIPGGGVLSGPPLKPMSSTNWGSKNDIFKKQTVYFVWKLNFKLIRHIKVICAMKIDDLVRGVRRGPPPSRYRLSKKF